MVRAQTRPTLGLGIGAIDLVELLEDARQVFRRYARPRIHHADGEMAVHHRRRDAHLAGIGELDGVTHQVEQHLGEALLVTEADRQGLGHFCLEDELLGLGQCIRCGPHRLDHVVERILAEVQVELPRLDLGDVEHGVDQPQAVFAVGADAR
jgi:hypothetical protein